MIEIKIFGKENCDACKSTKAKFETFLNRWEVSEKPIINFFDMDTIEGLTEGTMRGAHSVPTTIIEKDGAELARWDGKVPLSSEFKNILSN